MKRLGGGSDTRPTALLLSPEAPFPAVGGGALRTASLLAYLARRYAVDLVVFQEDGAPDPSRVIPAGLVREVHVLPLPAHARHAPARAFRNLRRFLYGRPPLNDRFDGFSRALAGFLRGRRYDLAVIEHFWCAKYCQALAPHCDRIVLDLHNVESVLYERYARTERWPVSLMFRRFQHACAELERRWFPRFALLLAASGQDALRVQELAPGCRADVYPNAIPSARRPERQEENVAIFSGNFEYLPNISAVRFFRARVWPLLRERWPGLVWRLLGKNPQGVARFVRGDPQIHLAGPVDNAVEALAAAKVVVAPMLAGSGTRVKILEAWAAGRAVVSTTVGAEGLPARDGEHLLLADGPEAFAEAVSSLLASPEDRARLGQAGRALYERHFTWEAAWRELDRISL